MRPFIACFALVCAFASALSPVQARQKQTAGVLGASAIHAQSQTLPISVSANEIEDIKILGASPAVADAVGRYYIESKVGTNFEPDLVATDVKKLYLLGYFDDIVVRPPEAGPRGGKVVTFVVKQKTNAPLEFEAAIIKPVQPGPDAGRTVEQFIASAWNVAASRILAAPAWVRSDRYRYVIEAKAPPEAGRSPGQSEAAALQWSVMNRALLVEKLKLAVHIEVRPAPIYALKVNKQGSKLKRSAGNGPAGCNRITSLDSKGVPPEVRIYDCRRMNMIWLAGLLRGWASDYIDKPVKNLTNLPIPPGGDQPREVTDGEYDFRLRWSVRQVTDGISADAIAADVDPEDRITIFEALKSQLGLDLTQQMYPGSYVVIDHIEKPE